MRLIDCSECTLRKGATAPVPGQGDITSPVFLIGEAPGYHEDKKGKPFVGQAGQELNKYLSDAGLDRSRCYVTNTVRCKPPMNRNPGPVEIQACRRWLVEELQQCKALALGVMGAVAGRALMGPDYDVEMQHGIPLWARDVVQQEILDEIGVAPLDNVKLVPMYHPALGLHETPRMGRIQEDFAALAAVVRGDLKPREAQIKEENMYLAVSEDSPEAYTFLEHALQARETGIVSIDTEAHWDGSPQCLSLSAVPGSAIVIMQEQTNLLQAVHDLVNEDQVLTVLHFAAYDLPMLLKMGIEPAHTVDSMVGAYQLQTLPQGLKALAYRLCDMRMSSYQDMIRGVQHEKATQFLAVASCFPCPPPPPETIWDPKPKMEWIVAEVTKPCTKRHKLAEPCPTCTSKSAETAKGCGTCDGRRFVRKETKRTGKEQVLGTDGGHWRTKQPHGAQKRIQRILGDFTTKQDVDPVERWFKLDGASRAFLEGLAGPFPEVDLSDIPQDEFIQYSARDADATLRVWLVIRGQIDKMGLSKSFQLDMAVLPFVLEMEKAGIRVDKRGLLALSVSCGERLDDICNEIDKLMKCRTNPASPKQVQQILLHCGLKPAKTTPTGEMSTDAEALQALIGKHPVIELLLEYRSLSKIKNAFADKLPGKADKNDRIHTSFRTTRTNTGRLSSANPNLQQVPTRTELGRQIRDCFIADEGSALVCIDYSQIEMRIAAHESQDGNMIEVFENDLDIHAATASKVFGLPIDRLDDKKHRYPAKRIGFGILYGLTPEGLLDQLILAGCEGWNLTKCKQLIDDWFGVYPGVKVYFQNTYAEARRQGYVSDLFGRIRRIPEMKSAIKRVRAAGERQAGSMKIQGGAAGVMKVAMRDLLPVYKTFQDWDTNCRPLLQVHDEIVSEVSLEILPQFIAEAKRVMESAVELRVPLKVDCEWGFKWGTIQEWEA